MGMMDFYLDMIRFKSLQSLTKEEIAEAIKSATDFFGMPFPQVQDNTYNPEGGTMFAHCDPHSYDDDWICYDMAELAQLNVSTYDALTLVLTHEATHRRTQMYKFPGPKNGAYAKECISDWYMGVRAGMLGMKDVRNVIEGLGAMNGCDTHPAGFIRKQFITDGVGKGILNKHHSGANFEYFINDFKEFYFKMLPTIEKEYPKHYSLMQRLGYKKDFDF